MENDQLFHIQDEFESWNIRDQENNAYTFSHVLRLNDRNCGFRLDESPPPNVLLRFKNC